MFKIKRSLSCPAYVFVMKGDNKLQTFRAFEFGHSKALLMDAVFLALSAWRNVFPHADIYHEESKDEWPHAKRA